MEQQEKKQTGKGSLVIGIVAIVAIAVLVGIIVFLLTTQDKGNEEKRQVLVTEDNVDEVIEEIAAEEDAQQNAPGYYTVTMFTEWHFKSGDEPSYDSYVENKRQNTNDVYFDIVMADDEDDVIYKSPVLSRGASIDNIKLDKNLEPGTYDTICIYNLVDEDQNSLSQVRIHLTLIIEG